MCGVVGVSLVPDAGAGTRADRVAAAGVRRLLHRGPDGHGVAGDERSAVGMCRLRVRGRGEPVPFAGADGPPGPESLAYNGEVYAVESGTGAAVVPADGAAEARAVARHRPDRLDGMYALVRRGADGSVHVARDPTGIKPLFLRHDRTGTMVASEIPALLELGGPPRVRAAAVDQFLLWGRVVDGGTFFDGVEPVRRGERLVLAGGRVRHRARATAARSWNGRPAGPDRLRDAVAGAVRRVLVADRPLGLAVSGGLDSTIVAAELARLGMRDLATVSVVPDGTGDGLRSLEPLELPGSAWRSWCHRFVEFGPHDLLDGIPGAVAALGEPTAMTSVPMYAALARLARDAGIVVLLLGEGADELFCGYRSYLRLPAAGSAAEFYLAPERDELARRLVGAERAAAARTALLAALPRRNGQDVAAVVREFEYEHSLEPLLRRADHLLMAAGVEGRTPFLHGDLPAIAASLHPDALLAGGQTKVALRRAYAADLGRFGTEVKRPFRAPVGAWLAGAGRSRVLRGIAGHTDRLAAAGLRPDGLAELSGRVAAGEPDAAGLAFAVLTLGAWLERWQD